MDKSLSLSELVGELRDGMTIGIGGWGGRRKPMAVIREILRSDLKDLTIVSYGGPDVGLLASAGKIRKLIFGFVSLDVFPLDAHFRRARQVGAFDVMELDEGMVQLGLKAAAMRLPFLPTRVGVATDVLRYNPGLKCIRSPYEDNEELVAMPALKLDAAIVHVNKADVKGNSWIYGPDPFFDEWFCRAAERAFLTCEELVETAEFDSPEMALRMPIERALVHGVCEVPFGAHPTSCAPGYGIDIDHLGEYSKATGAAFADYRGSYIDGRDEESYRAAVGGAGMIRRLPLPVF
ncbi:CoA transferase subunit A [Luteithermobacter gelatinilyticus]|uniref:CoA transferase subunit A n=1 Tax=Luteithermobacter gelatinilyticus TaxID=2582913 RepID=UPI001107560D|nr:CoA-transferase [Luteithermobacter gelatinilyticus]